MLVRMLCPNCQEDMEFEATIFDGMAEVEGRPICPWCTNILTNAEIQDAVDHCQESRRLEREIDAFENKKRLDEDSACF